MSFKKAELDEGEKTTVWIAVGEIDGEYHRVIMDTEPSRPKDVLQWVGDLADTDITVYEVDMAVQTSGVIMEIPCDT